MDYKKIAEDNKIPLDKTLVVGQTIVVIPDTNTRKYKQITVNGYAFTNIDRVILDDVLPSLTYLSIFRYSTDPDGNLNTINDEELIAIAKGNDVVPIMVITNIGLEDRFDSDLAHAILNNEDAQNRLITNILSVMRLKGYGGLNIDFEYVYPEDKEAYINFLKKAKTELEKNNYLLSVALVPKYSDDQEGLLYEAHDYSQIGEIADYVILMTYEWGYSGGPARAVAPVNLVERVLDYATKKIPNNKMLLGIPNYGYDWTLPYVEGNLARSVGNYEAVDIANYYRQSINYDYEEQSPYFNYYDSDSFEHEVWFEDARSIQAKLELVIKYNIEGVSYWKIDKFFPQNYLILNHLFAIKNH